MFLQFFKTSFRIFTRERIYSFLNIAGLAIGITVALIIFLYLQQDLTYDRYHKNARNIYRVNSIYVSSGKENKFALSPISFGPRIIEEFPEVRAYTRLVPVNRGILKYEGNKFNEESLFVADSGIFRVFTHKFIYGDPSTALEKPFSIVLSRKLAHKYFGDVNPLGKVLMLNDVRPVTVTAVIEDMPNNVHARYEGLIQIYDPNGDSKNASFYDINVYTYLLFPENYDVNEFYKKFPAFHEKYAAAKGKMLKQEYKAVLQSLLKTHFSKEWSYDLPNGNRAYIIAFLVIGVLVLSLSCINYLNLTTARAERRRKEISMKKILGSGRSELMIQFLGESMLMAVIATVIALGISQFILGFTSFNELIDKNLEIAPGSNQPFIIGVIILTVIVGLSSGLYPALHLSDVHPLKSIRGGSRPGRSAVSFRKILVVTQLIISIGVILCTLLVKHQLDFIRTRDLGINKENLLIVPLRDTAVTNHLTTLKDQLSLNSSVEAVSTAFNLPASAIGNNLYRAETLNGLEENNFFTIVVGYDFLRTMGIKLISGRDFDRSFTTDPRAAFLINETLAKKMGWNEPLGKKLQQNFNAEGMPYFDGVVVGVVKDFNYASLHNAIEPLVMRVQATEGGQLLVKMNGKDVVSTMRFIENTWKEFGAEFPLDYSFLDKNYDKLYKKDKQQNSLIKIFSRVCILISFLGLLTLASYITKNRTREIAIRKVYGSSPTEVTYMLYREILILTLVAAVIATPLAYWLSDRLLESFAYKAGFSFGIILTTTAGAMLVSLATVSFHSIKASFTNPANSLKYE